MTRLAPVAPFVCLLAVACPDGEGDGGPPATADTATAARATPAPAPASVGGLQARRTDVPGVVADLLSAERKEGRLTVALRFRNTTGEPREVSIPADWDRWRVVAGERDWAIAREADGDPAGNDPPDRVLDPAQSALWRGAFVAPPPGVESFRLEVPRVRPFEDVPISDVE